ncbi:uncharacterized protein G2W53_012624 [Senna tora]|uniref:Gag1-like clamp domain-containing protein n=1 Tax=Senna tora TaxID=362788 RepID=A0A834U165_9FABA|nr:uncharacterized protein G2W53_012624 [Senna tora]
MLVVEPTLQQSRGCFGCFTKPPGQTVKEDKRSEHLLSSSTIEMDQSAAQSQKSISSSSIGTSNKPSNPQIDHPEFVNHGLILWNQTRLQWVENKVSERQTQVREPIISEDDTYESLLGSNKPFSHPIPLGEMIDFLVDIWEEEGLYD